LKTPLLSPTIVFLCYALVEFIKFSNLNIWYQKSRVSFRSRHVQISVSSQLFAQSLGLVLVPKILVETPLCCFYNHLMLFSILYSKYSLPINFEIYKSFTRITRMELSNLFTYWIHSFVQIRWQGIRNHIQIQLQVSKNLHFRKELKNKLKRNDDEDDLSLAHGRKFIMQQYEYIYFFYKNNFIRTRGSFLLKI